MSSCLPFKNNDRKIELNTHEKPKKEMTSDEKNIKKGETVNTMSQKNKGNFEIIYRHYILNI